MSDTVHPALLVAAAAKDPQILRTFPLTEIAETLARWDQPILQELRIPLAGEQTARTIRRMPAEQAAIVARHAETDEPTFRALHADRRISVQRALAVNPAVPAAVRRAWLAEHADLKRPLNRNDKVAVALVAGILAEGWPADGPEAAGLGALLEGCSTWTWRHLFDEMPPAALWPFLQTSGLDATARLTLLIGRAGAMPEGARPSLDQLTRLLTETLPDRDGQDPLRAGITLPTWLLRLLLQALPELPEQLLSAAYTTAGLIARTPSGRQQDGSWGVRTHGRILRRILTARSRGQDVPLPERIHPAHLAAALTEDPDQTVRVDEALLDALIAGMPLYGFTGDQLATLTGKRSIVDLSGLEAQVWQQRLDTCQTDEHPGRNRRWAYAGDLILLLAGAEQAARLPEPLLRLCGRYSVDGPVLALLCGQKLPGADELRQRLSGQTDLPMPTLCGLIAHGHVSLQESINALEADAWPYAQRGFRPAEGAEPFSDDWNSLSSLHETDGAAGLIESFRQTPVTGRLALLGALSARSDTSRWQAAAGGLAPLLQETLQQPHTVLAGQLNRLHTRWGTGPQALSAAALILLEAGHHLPELLTVDGPLAGRSAAGLDGAAGAQLLLRLDIDGGRAAEHLDEAARMLRPGDLLDHPDTALLAGRILGRLLGDAPEAWRLFAVMAGTWQGSTSLLAASVHELTRQPEAAARTAS